MTLTHPSPTPAQRAGRRYLRPPEPLFFPVEEKVPESTRHFEARVALFQSLRNELGASALVSSDQFLYWDPTNPKKCLAPDVAVRRGAEYEPLQSWKTWERGAPHVGIEIASDADASELRLEEKLERYRQAGIAEVVYFDPEETERPLRLWDLVDGDLVERELASPEALLCDALGLYWCIHRDAELGPTLRLARGTACARLVPTPAEAERAAKEEALAGAEVERLAKEAALTQASSDRLAKEAALTQASSDRLAKEAALARVAELEAELRGKR